MKFLIKLFAISFILLFQITNAFDIDSILWEKSSVIDKTNTLNETEISQIKTKIDEIRKKYTAEILVVLIKSTNGYDISELWVKIWQKVWVWKKDTDNWIVILIAKEDKKWNISTWYWMEWVLPDLLANKIWQKNFSIFKENKFFDWIYWALNDIDKYISWDKSIISKQTSNNDDLNFIYIIEFIFITIFSSFYLRKLVKNKKHKEAFLKLFISYLIFLPIIIFIIWIWWIFINIFVWLLAWVIWIFWKPWNNSDNNWWFGWGGFGWWDSWWWFGWGGFWWGWSSWKW